jgi:two-component sensor histidine kinase
MPSTYSDLKIELIATGEQSGTWGTTTNTNLGTAIEEAITGSADVAFLSSDITISLSNTNATQTARNLRLNLTGTSGGARILTVPAIQKIYLINNGLADACTIKNSTGTGIAVPAGKSMFVYNDGTNVVNAITHLSSLTLATDLAVADGGTGASDAATARTNLGLGTMATQSSSSVGISGGAITGLTNLTTTNFAASGTATAVTQSAGDNSTKLATTAYVDNEVGGLGTMATQNANAVNITGGTVAASFTGNLTGNASTATSATSATSATTATTATTANALNTGNGYQASYLRLNTGSGSSAGWLYASAVSGLVTSGGDGNVGSYVWDAGYNFGGKGAAVSGSPIGQPGTWRIMNKDFVITDMTFMSRIS